MTSTTLRRGPFIWRTDIYFDDLDPMGMVHNSRYVLLIERTEAHFNLSQGRRWESNVSKNSDQFYAIREQCFAFTAPIRGTCEIEVHMWLASMGRSSLTWEFQVRSPDGLHATARRTLVKLDPATFTAVPWSDHIRLEYAAIAKARQADKS